MPTYTSKYCYTCQNIFQVLPRNLSQKYCSRQCAHISSRTLSKTLNRVSNCTNCNTLLAKGQYQFCSRSCSALHHNKNRTTIQNSKKKERVCKRCSKLYTDIHQCLLKKVIKPKYVRTCPICLSALLNSKKKYCVPCSPNISHYRTLCKFLFNVFDFPNEFNLQLIKEHGWFSPNGYNRRNSAVNLNGVSRDHLYTVSDGFKNNIDPILLAHPANCSIMVHNGPNGNNSKKKSSITIDELKTRIDQWNQKYSEKT